MKTYRELHFKGNEQQLQQFVKDIEKYQTELWEYKKTETSGTPYVYYNYSGEEVDKAFVAICLNKREGGYRVVNIIPTEQAKSDLTVDEYNSILMQFYDDIIMPYKEENKSIKIVGPTQDVFDPQTIISDSALKKLRAFCLQANKSTGASHHCDQERWYDFIIQTVEDNKVFDYSTLATFLQDINYWGEKPSNFSGVMGKFAWDEISANKLASQYDEAISILQYYKNSKGV